MGETRIRLASFQFPCVQAARNLSGGLGWRERPKSCGRGITRAMRFSSFTASCACLRSARLAYVGHRTEQHWGISCQTDDHHPCDQVIQSLSERVSNTSCIQSTEGLQQRIAVSGQSLCLTKWPCSCAYFLLHAIQARHTGPPSQPKVGNCGPSAAMFTGNY